MQASYRRRPQPSHPMLLQTPLCTCTSAVKLKIQNSNFKISGAKQPCKPFRLIMNGDSKKGGRLNRLNRVGVLDRGAVAILREKRKTAPCQETSDGEEGRVFAKTGSGQQAEARLAKPAVVFRRTLYSPRTASPAAHALSLRTRTPHPARTTNKRIEWSNTSSLFQLPWPANGTILRFNRRTAFRSKTECGTPFL
jgi:hypothetical protein